MAVTAEELRGLLERVEEAKGPNYDLEQTLLRAFGFRLCRDQKDTWWFSETLNAGFAHNRTNFTTSLDAAIALVERVLPGWRRYLYANPALGMYTASLTRPDGQPATDYVQGSSGALALIAALLHAMIAEMESEDVG